MEAFKKCYFTYGEITISGYVFNMAVFLWRKSLMKNNKRLNLYFVDIKYIRNLQKADDKVMSVSPQKGKEFRPFVGIITVCNNQKYIIPLSSPKAKHYNMRTSADFEKIFGKNKKLLAVLNFNLMIPVKDAQLTVIDLTIHKNDSKKIVNFKNLCMNELAWIRRPEITEIIRNKANILYNLYVSESNYKGKDRCVNFQKLEEICEKYNQDLNKFRNNLI